MRKVNSKFMVVLFLAYIVILFRITVFRSSFSLSHFMQNGAVNLTLFQDYLPLLQQGRWSLFLYLFAGNIICFFPLGFGLMASRKVVSLRTAALCGFGLSLVIETMQYLFGTGISELDDLVLNTFGTWAGAAAVQSCRYLLSCRNTQGIGRRL